MDIVVREYRLEDFPAAFCVGGPGSGRRAAQLRKLKCSPPFYGFVAEAEGKIVGFVVMEDLGNDSHYVVQINSFPKRKRIGANLMRRVFAHVPGAHISLCVNTDNVDAHAFYRFLGFRRCGYTADYRRGGDKFWYNIDLGVI